jgi:heptosyltransferase-2
MQPILILKTGALGDVLRTTAILPGLRERHPGARLEWLTAPGARELVDGHPLVDRVHLWREGDAELLRALRETRWGRVISLDDEEPLCALASSLETDALTGAFLDGEGRRTYTDDAAAWFDMGLLSRLGKAEADRLKVANTRTHPELLCEALGVAQGHPELPLPPEAHERASTRLEPETLARRSRWIGLNTGAGGRWPSKQLSIERTVELARLLDAARPGELGFVLLGGPDEAERNRILLAGLVDAGCAVIDGGPENTLLEFAALVDGLDLLVTSDSLALHVAIARRVPVVAFFAPTSAAEIELHGRGECVRSTAADYCSYRPDADSSSITPERVRDAALRVLASTDGSRSE